MVALERLQDILGIELYALFLVRLLSLASEQTVVKAQCPGMPLPQHCSELCWKPFNVWDYSSDELVASYQTGYLKTASCKQFPPTPVSLPIHFAGC